MKTPEYKCHPRGQGYCRIGRTFKYFGKYELPASRAAYDKFIARWLAERGANAGLTIDDLALQFFENADTYYRHPDGSPTGEFRNLRAATRFLIALFGETPVADFGPRRLMLVRDEMIKAGMCRTNVNRQVHRVRRLFSWGVKNELVDGGLYMALKSVEPLRVGRSAAVESDPVAPIAETTVHATLEKLSPTVADMVRLQLLTGARPNEICMLRPCDVTIRTDGLWCYKPRQHKTAWKGKTRVILIGPQAQEILRPYLERALEAYCFSPAESEAARSVARRAERKTPLTPSQAARNELRAAKRRGRAPLADRYVKDSYGLAVRRACRLRIPAELKGPRGKKENAASKARRLERLEAWERENVWSPNRLRHLRATAIREDFGLEAASAVLGHSGLTITETYAQRNDRAAAEVMLKIG